MKFTADKKSLHEVITTASKACATKSVLNVLDGVWLALNGNILTVVGYDLEMGIVVPIEVTKGTGDGSVVIDPKLLANMIKKISGDTIDFESDVKTVKVKSGKTRLSLPCKDGNEFPEVKTATEGNSFKIKESLLKELLTRVWYAASKVNMELEGVRIDIEGGVLYTVSTDGNRLAAKSCTISCGDTQFMIPSKVVGSLVTNLSDDEDSEITISISKNQICFSKDDIEIFSRILEGKFIDYKRIIEGAFPKTAVVNVKELAISTERCLLLQTDKLRIPATCTIEDGIMNITCKTAIGTVDDEIELISANDDINGFSLNFNPKFMLEALKNTQCPEVKIAFQQELKPFKITPAEDNGEFIFIIVPVRSS